MNNKFKRPISPHLTIHKKVQTALLSILHRATGILLSIGTVFLVLWLFLLAIGEQYFELLYFFYDNALFNIILFLWSFAILYHLINGLRYLIWSIGYGIELNNVHRTGYLVLFITLLSTTLLWLTALDKI